VIGVTSQWAGVASVQSETHFGVLSDFLGLSQTFLSTGFVFGFCLSIEPTSRAYELYHYKAPNACMRTSFDLMAAKLESGWQ
jgi:hypothetical protein